MTTIDDLGQLKRLAIFAKVIERGSFTQAAKALGMSRSGVSEQVALLESYLACRLLNRTTRQLSLTSDGERVLDEAVQIERALQATLEKIEDKKNTGRLRLTTTHDFAIQWLTPKLRDYQKNNPAITFDLIISDDRLDLVEQQIDLAIRIGAPPKDSSLVSRPFLRERMQLFASPERLRAHQITGELKDLEKIPWIILSQLHPANQVQLHSTVSTESLDLSPTQFNRVDSPIVMIHQLISGMGIGLMFPSIVEKEIAQGQLVHVASEWKTDQKVFSITYSSRKHMPLRVRLFVDYLLGRSGK